MRSLTVVFGRIFSVPVLTNCPVLALRSPIRLCRSFAIVLTSFRWVEKAHCTFFDVPTGLVWSPRRPPFTFAVRIGAIPRHRQIEADFCVDATVVDDSAALQ